MTTSNPIPTPSEWVQMAPGIRRRVLEDSDTLMLIEVYMEPGAQVATHQHPHVQVSYVVEGRGVYTIGDAERNVATGDSVILLSNIPHSFTATEPSHLLDVFNPPREDFR